MITQKKIGETNGKQEGSEHKGQWQDQIKFCTTLKENSVVPKLGIVLFVKRKPRKL